MTTHTRRDVLKFAIGAGTLLLPGSSVLAEIGPDRDPHFFLLIVLNGGADPSYMFDARPLSMTMAGKIQNYLGEEPQPWSGKNGLTSLSTSLVKPLAPFQGSFSVLNGVYMTPSFDGHLQNMNFLFAGDPFGGDSFVPHLNLAETGREPESLDAILAAQPVHINVHNHSSVIPLYPKSLHGLTARLQEIETPQPRDELSDFLRERLKASSRGSGRFSAGAGLMLSGFERAPEVHRRLARLAVPNPEKTPVEQSLALITECFRHSISRAAIYVLPEFFDVHAAEQAKAQPKLFVDAVGKIARLLEGLRETPFDSKRSMFDVTTVMVASEFGRTMRAPGAPIDQTGTNHNQFSNSILIGGKGIRGGMVIGASDLANESATVSKAHLAMDPLLEKAMGHPFDFRTATVRTDLPEEFRITDYLTIGSVVNTVYSLFDVPKSRYRILGRDLPAAPVLRAMLR